MTGIIGKLHNIFIATESLKLISNRLKEAKGTPAEKYGHSHYYEQIHASGKPKPRGFVVLGARGKWNFVRNISRIPRRPTYMPLKQCLEDNDKDLRRLLTIDTQCYYPPGFAPKVAASSVRGFHVFLGVFLLSVSTFN